MFFLILALMVTLTLVVSLKVAHEKGLDADNVILVNYGVAATVSLVLGIRRGTLGAFSALSNLDLSTVFVEQSLAGTMFLSILFGAGVGTLFVVNILVINTNIRNNGAGISTLFSRSSFLITIVLSVLFFSERVTGFMYVGIVLTIAALAIAGGVGKHTQLVKPLFLLSALVLLGMIESAHVAFNRFASQAYVFNFTLVVFSVALLLFIVVFLCKRRKKGPVPFRRPEIILGCLMGLPNAFSNVFQIMALETVPASILFPTLAAGSLLIITLISLAFKENLGPRKLIAIGLCIVSLVLVNLPN
ncbi:MAG: EamA family transporter [Oscillospiraceae bacterium]|nr:EamA family transporter [Oscillospiraceae bacterium]